MWGWDPPRSCLRVMSSLGLLSRGNFDGRAAWSVHGDGWAGRSQGLLERGESMGRPAGGCLGDRHGYW